MVESAKARGRGTDKPPTPAGRRTSKGSKSSWLKATSVTDLVRGLVDRVDAVVNFGWPESHVDRSIESPGEFITTDVFGTFCAA